ncbi:very-long-chain (3R)-3-hydroxyacyl-[acyl-carrier protein] dehydratase [Asbolus verrucosus]|uniref:Very-long-chain (3R)-3-hydroxyacyl-CoA dehydratase n=1 Tax=Asbolus verrucosus TaxID=1661398 RepID=A0A482W032_ASBVE|nr:very-long-chain (3R)-3-hydroxyacyl-[acyl-carrier protein] dehydratase [Asbolus verrucosus]
MTQLSPFVFWAQNEKNIFIKVDLKDVKDPDIILETRKLQFQSKGVGARGLNDYAFVINFNSDIDVKESVHKVTDSRVDFTIKKLEKAWWPRLMEQTQKPAWLKIDHDRFQSEDMDDNEVADVRNDYPNLYEKLQKEEFGYKKEDFKKVYLSLYNLFMYVGFMYVVCVLSIRYLKEGPDSFPGTYAAVGPAMCFLHLIQLLEVMHPLFGYVKGGMFIPLLQVGGRLFIIILMLEFEPRLQTMPVVFYLFMTWSAIEIIRYPYYMSQLFKKENGLLTWLRYTAWMICYPIGFVCEGVIIFRNLIFLEQSDRWTIALSTPFEITLRFSTLLRIHLLFFIIPAMYTLMSHMYKARQQKIGPKPKKIKTK